jgi:UDP-GlcNAc:undecaprenyl-phosphate GlcNAc-1-phosphate transferase
MGAYLSILVISVGVSALLTFIVRKTTLARGWKSTPVYGRHTHTKPLPRLGGIAICLTFLLVLPLIPVSRLAHNHFSGQNYIGILVPVLIIFLMGAFDDLRPLKPRWKLAIEALAATVLYSAGFGIHNLGTFLGGHLLGDAVGLVLTVLWVLLITNAFNLIDGLDGLAAGSASISCIFILLISLLQRHDLVTMMAVVLLGAILGFLPFNRYPASIFMGDSGSLFIGFLLSALALASPQKAGNAIAGIATAALVFGVPILDVTLAVARRFLRGHPLFRGDTDHIHHKLLRRGLSHPQVVLLLYGVTFLFGLASLSLVADGRLLAPVLVFAAIGVCVGVQQLHYAEFSEILQPASRHREIVTEPTNIYRAAEALRFCPDFRAIGQVLQETLQSSGFDGIRLKNLDKDGFPTALLHTLDYDSDGKMYLTWSERKTDETPWEYTFELISNAHRTVGYASLFRMPPSDDLRLNLDTLAEEFSMALSEAVERSIVRMQVPPAPDQNAELDLVRAACRGGE